MCVLWSIPLVWLTLFWERTIFRSDHHWKFDIIMPNSLCDVLLQYMPWTAYEAESLHSSYIAGCVLNAFLSYTAITLNISAIYAVKKTPSLSHPLRILLLNLAGSDLGVGLLCQPLFIALLVEMLWNNNPSFSTYTAFSSILTLFSFVSFFGVMIMNLDRFMAIYLHLRYQEVMTHQRVTKGVIALWVFSAFLSLVTLWTSMNISTVIFAIVEAGCLVTTTCLNYKIYLNVRRHRNQINAIQVQNGDEMANALSIWKSALGAFYVHLVFVFCYLPHIIIYAVVAIFGVRTVIRSLSVFTLTIVLLNSSLNPIIYCSKMRQVRCAMVNILRNTLLRYT